MEEKTYTTIDRKTLGWPSGPWDNEPDKRQWPDAKTGLPCLAVRHPSGGHWCGYVGVAPEHTLHGKDYDDVEVEVHGGLTFANHCQPGETEASGVCHVPALGEPDHVWWFGFDCAHCDDYSPRDKQHAQERGYPFLIQREQEYRTLEYVEKQCAELAEQLAEKTEGA